MILPLSINMEKLIHGGELSDHSGRNWEHPYFDEFNTSFNPQTTINKQNVRGISLKWGCVLDAANFGVTGDERHASEPRQLPRVQTIALVIDGRVFVADGGNRVYSVDAESGAPRWSFLPPLDGVVGHTLIH